MLFDGQVFVGLQARAASIEYANMNVAVTQEMIKANIYKIYYQLVVAKKQVQIFDINIERTEKLLHDTKELYKNGFQEKLDVDKVNVNLSNIRTDKLKVENRIKTGYTALKYLMGMPVKESLVLTDTLNEANLRQVLLEADTSQYQNRKEYQLLKVTEKLGQYNIKRYKMSYLPTVSLSAAYAQNAQRQTFDFFKGGEPWFKSTFIGLRIDVPIFDGFAKDSRIKKAKLELQKTQTTMADLKNNIATEIDTARTSLQSALVVLDEQQKNMSLAEQVYNQTKKKYEQGLGSNLEVTNAEADLKTAQNNYFSALYDAVVARIEYLRATGQLQ
jgi:outer membrane protein TolC